MKLILPDGKSLAELLQQATYTHHQDLSLAVWTIPHKLGKHPSVTVVESTGIVFYGTVQYVDSNTVTLTFLGACTGKAYLN